MSSVKPLEHIYPTYVMSKETLANMPQYTAFAGALLSRKRELLKQLICKEAII